MRTKVARLIVNENRMRFTVREGRKALSKCITELKNKNEKAKYLITPGGFLGVNLPKIKNMKPGWNTDPKDIKACASVAESIVYSVMNKKMTDLAQNTVSYITFGIDSNDDIDTNHVELVIVYDVKGKSVDGFTGKSYPILDQEKTLLRVSNVQSHFFKHGKDKVLVLGCHDLNLFSPRVKARICKGKERYKVVKEFERASKLFSPNIVLHHPHITDSSRIWALGWSGVRKQFGKNIEYASALRMKRNGNRTVNKDNIRKATASSSNLVRDIFY